MKYLGELASPAIVGVELYGRTGFESPYGQGVEPVVTFDHCRDGGTV